MSRVTAPSLRKRKAEGEKLAMLTAYDYPSAKIVDACGVDLILVGDSCAMVIMGRPDTLSVTVDEMLHHTKLVTAAAENALVVGDMPFGSYNITPEDAARNAARFIAEGGAQAVKLEGSMERSGDSIRAILRLDIPVMGHLGLTPQSVHKLGGFRVQGKEEEGARQLVEAAKALEDAGCFALVLECIPAPLGAEISKSLSIPTIGIGAGSGCDGQVLVMHDILGWGETRFAKTYVDVKALMEKAFTAYVNDVKSGAYPAEEHQYTYPDKDKEPQSTFPSLEHLYANPAKEHQGALPSKAHLGTYPELEQLFANPGKEPQFK